MSNFSFLGHFAPGLAFLLLSTWWSFNSGWMYWRSRMTGKPFLNQASYQGSERIPIETMFKVLGLTTHLLLEIFTGCDGEQFLLHNSQHITMLGFFLINAAMDLIHFFKVPSPRDLDYLSAILAFVMEGFLFSQHILGRSALDQKVHTLLYYPVIIGAFFGMLELVKRDSWAIGMIRASAVMVHGSWMIQAAFILFPEWVNREWSTWDSEDHNQMMILPMMFAGHIMAVVFWQVIIMAITYIGAKSNCGSDRVDIKEYIQYSRVPDEPEEIA